MPISPPYSASSRPRLSGRSCAHPVLPLDRLVFGRDRQVDQQPAAGSGGITFRSQQFRWKTWRELVARAASQIPTQSQRGRLEFIQDLLPLGLRLDTFRLVAPSDGSATPWCRGTTCNGRSVFFQHGNNGAQDFNFPLHTLDVPLLLLNHFVDVLHHSYRMRG